MLFDIMLIRMPSPIFDKKLSTSYKAYMSTKIFFKIW